MSCECDMGHVLHVSHVVLAKKCFVVVVGDFVYSSKPFGSKASVSIPVRIAASICPTLAVAPCEYVRCLARVRNNNQIQNVEILIKYLVRRSLLTGCHTWCGKFKIQSHPMMSMLECVRILLFFFAGADPKHMQRSETEALEFRAQFSSITSSCSCRGTAGPVWKWKLDFFWF